MMAELSGVSAEAPRALAIDTAVLFTLFFSPEALKCTYSGGGEIPSEVNNFEALVIGVFVPAKLNPVT